MAFKMKGRPVVQGSAFHKKAVAQARPNVNVQPNSPMKAYAGTQIKGTEELGMQDWVLPKTTFFNGMDKSEKQWVSEFKKLNKERLGSGSFNPNNPSYNPGAGLFTGSVQEMVARFSPVSSWTPMMKKASTAFKMNSPLKQIELETGTPEEQRLKHEESIQPSTIANWGKAQKYGDFTQSKLNEAFKEGISSGEGAKILGISEFKYGQMAKDVLRAPSAEHLEKVAAGEKWYQKGLFGKVTDPRNIYVNRARTKVLKDFYKNNPLPGGYFDPSNTEMFGKAGPWDNPPTWEGGYNAEQQKIVELAKIQAKKNLNSELNADGTASNNWGDYKVDTVEGKQVYSYKQKGTDDWLVQNDRKGIASIKTLIENQTNEDLIYQEGVGYTTTAQTPPPPPPPTYKEAWLGAKTKAGGGLIPKYIDAIESGALTEEELKTITDELPEVSIVEGVVQFVEGYDKVANRKLIKLLEKYTNN